MPTENIPTENLFMSFGDEEYRKLEKSKSIELVDIEDDVLQLLSQPFEANIAVSVPKDLTAQELWLILCGVCTEKQISQNNWRRRHNMPMKRGRRK